MLKNALERLVGLGRVHYRHNEGSGECKFQGDYPGVLIDERKRGRDEDLYQRTLAALQKAQPGEVPVVRSHYSYKNRQAELIGYTSHYFRFRKKA